MPCEIHALRYFTPRNRKEDCTPPVVTGLLVVLEGQNSLEIVLGFNEDQLVFEDLLEDTHFVPFDDDMLHVLVGRKEAHHAVWDDATEFDHEAAVVAHDTRVLSLVKLGTHGELVRPLGQDNGLDRVAWQMDLESPRYFRNKVQHPGVDFRG